MNGIAYLSVGTEQRRDANFTTEIGLRSTVFAPVETACGHIAAEPCEDRPVRHRFHTSAPAAPATNAPKTEQTKNTNDAPDDIEATTLVKAGTQAPDFRVEMFDGTTFTLGSLRGKVVLLNFWATWCGPCREELSRVQKDIIDRFKGNEDFVFLPVSRGETRETVAAFREKMGYTFPMGLDPEQKIYRLYASNYIPRNFLIGKDGKVISATIGYEAPEFDELILLIERQLNSAN